MTRLSSQQPQTLVSMWLPASWKRHIVPCLFEHHPLRRSYLSVMCHGQRSSFQWGGICFPARPHPPKKAHTHTYAPNKTAIANTLYIYIYNFTILGMCFSLWVLFIFTGALQKTRFFFAAIRVEMIYTIQTHVRLSCAFEAPGPAARGDA